MSGHSGWRAALLLGAAMCMSGTAWAQSSATYGYSDQEADDADPYDPTANAPSSRSTAPARDEEDFSDVIAQDEQRQTPSSPDSDQDPLLTYEDGEEGQMTDACALAARDEAERDGGYAEVRQMGTPRESRNGFTIDGDVDVRSGWRAQDGRLRHFSCTIANGRIQDIYFQRDTSTR